MRRLKSVLSCLKYTLRKSRVGEVGSRCMYQGNASCFGVKEGVRCASFYNAAAETNPVPSLKLLSQNVFFDKATRQLFVSPSINAQDEWMIPNILAVIYQAGFQRPNMPAYQYEDGRLNFDCIFGSPVSSIAEFTSSICFAKIPENVYIDETTIVDLSGHFMPPDWNSESVKLKSNPLLYNLTAPDLRFKKEGMVNAESISRFNGTLNKLLREKKSSSVETPSNHIEHPDDQPTPEAKDNKSWLIVTKRHVKSFCEKHFAWIASIILILLLILVAAGWKKISKCIKKREYASEEKEDISIEMVEPDNLSLQAQEAMA